MPTVLRWRGYRCFFYSNEGSEPPHVHVRRGSSEIKVWLGDLSVVVNIGFPPHEVNEILDHLADHRDELTGKWHEHFGN